MSLDEPTAPADIDWSEIRSATEARDWRRAWQAVGTDHAGDATPGETYLLSKAAGAKATAAALVAWRKVEMPLRMARIDERHENNTPSYVVSNGLHSLAATESWQRIKRIAGWASQARAQYQSPKQAAARHAWNMTSTPHGADDFRQEYQGIPPAEPVALTRDNRGEITGTVTIAPSTSRSIAAMLATQARLTGGAAMSVEREGDTITITPSSDMIRWQRPDPAAATSHVGIATHATIPPRTSATIAAALEQYASMTGNIMNVQGDGRGGIVVTPRNSNPNPRGPQPRRRSRT